MPRFTISHHTGSAEGDHYDLMLERTEALQTWRLRHTNFQDPQTAPRIKDHRKTYLDYEGEVSGGRGRVAVWDTGACAFDVDRPERIIAALSGKRVRTRLLLAELPPEKNLPPRWSVTDAATEVRRKAAAFLRGAALEDAPTEELAALRTALSHQEQMILAQVDQYARGGAVEWSLVETDAELCRKIDRERARWQHPWLAAVREYADRIMELTELLRRQKPG